MASQIVRAEELNQTTEPLPGLLSEMDKAAGLAAGGFRKMVNEGQVTSDFFANTLIKALENFDGAAAATTGNIKAYWNDHASAYTNMVAAYEQPISDSFTPMILGSTEAMKLMAENSELVSTAVGVTMYAALGRGASAAVMLTREKLALVISERNQAQAAVASSQATIAATTAEIQRLEVMQASAPRLFAMRGGEAKLTAARTAQAAATNTLTAAQSRLNVVMRVGSGLLATLGGPVGVAMIAAGALTYFATSANDAKLDTESLKNEVHALLGQMNKLEQSRLTSAIEKQKELVKQLQDEYRKVAMTPAPGQSLWQKLSESNSEMRERQIREANESAAAVTKVQVELMEAERNLTALEEKLAKARSGQTDTGTKPPKTPPVDPKADKEANKLLENLQRQIALYGKTSEVAKVRYETEHGALKDINAAMKEKLLLAAQEIDAKKQTDSSAIDAFYKESDELNNAYQMRLAMQADAENAAKTKEKYAYEDRLSDLSQSFQKAYEQAAGNQELMDALEREYFANREVLHADHEANLTEIEKQAQEDRKRANFAVASTILGSSEQMFSAMADLAKQNVGEQSNSYKTLFAISKGFAIAKAGLNMWMAVSEASKADPWYMAIPAMATATANAATIGAAIASANYMPQAHDGIDRVPKDNEGTWLLKANEMVLNPKQADSFRWMVTMMQQMKTMQAAAMTASAGSMAAGGAPVTLNVQGVNKDQVKATARMRNGQIEVDMMINQAVDASMAAMYEDADNGGPVSQRMKAQ